MNYYERHIGDYLKKTAHLSLLEHGIYGRLLDVYYTRECPIEDTEVARLIGARSKDEKAALAIVLAEFFKLTNGTWSHTRCDEEIARYQRKVEHNRAVGKLGGRPKKSETQKEPGGFSVGSESEPEQNPLQSPDTSNQKEIPPTPSGVAPLVPPEPLALALPAKASEVCGRAVRKCPVSFELSADLLAWAREKHPGVNVIIETEKFRDHTFKTSISDWPGAWRNWVRKANEYASTRPVPASKHAGFAAKDYRQGVTEDGSLA